MGIIFIYIGIMYVQRMGIGVWAKMGKSRGEVVYGPEAELLLL